MNEIKINNTVNFGEIEFTFVSPTELIPEKMEAVLADQGELKFASIGTSVGKEFPMKNAENIKFSLEAEFKAALGVFRKKEKLFTALEEDGLNQQLANLLNLDIGSKENLFALRWGYKFGAGADGKVPLFSLGAPVNLTFGVKGKTGGLSILLHSRPNTDTVAVALKETLDSWKLPQMVNSIEDLNPKTTVIFETFSDLKVALGVEYGYDFNWIRKSFEIGGLAGELGLKIETGFKAKFGFSAVGDYALALSRESEDEKIRVQVFRLKQRGWSFAFNGGISSQFESDDFPDNVNDFVKAVFNLNGSQVLKDFEKWTNEDVTLAELLGTEIESRVNDFVRRVAGMTADEAIDVVMNRFRDFITKWHQLPHEVSSYLYKFIGEASGDALEKLKGFLTTVQGLQNDPDAIVAEIQKHLNFVKFFDVPDNSQPFIDPVEKWLTAVSTQGIASLLAGFEDQRARFNETVNQTLAILSGDKFVEILENLQAEIDDKLGLDKIMNLNPSDWLKKRLADFLGESPAVAELEKIRNTIIELNKQADKFYKLGYEALLKKYSFDVNYAFQKTTTNTALIDLTLDFSGEKLAQANDCLKLVKKGDFSNLLLGKDENGNQINCVEINQAVFTHGIKRSVHLDVNIPYFSATLDHITNSVAEGKFVEMADGKLWVFTLNAEDIVKKKKSLSKLAITAELTEKAGLRKFSDENNKLNYTFLFGKAEVERKYIELRYEMAAHTYLSSAFSDANGTFSKYLTELDKELDDKGFPDSDEFGNVLTSMQISLPGKILSFWNDVGRHNSGDTFYRKMSELVQTTFRKWIPLNFIQDPEQYREQNTFPVLAYMALPPLFDDEDDGVFYWKFRNPDKRKAILERADFQTNLRKNLSDAGQSATNNEIAKIINFTHNNEDGKRRFEILCGFERKLIEKIVETAEAFNDYKEAAEGDQSKKVKELAEFGEKFTDTFNEEIGGIDFIPKGALRPLGLLLLLKLAQLKKPEFSEEKFAAIFELLVLKPDVENFKEIRDKFLEGEFPNEASAEDTEKILLQQRIVNVDGPAL